MEEGLPGERGVMRIDVVEAVAEEGRGLSDRHRERLLAEGEERATGPVLRLGDRRRKLGEQHGIHPGLTVRRRG